MKTMTIRNIPDEVVTYITNKAASESRSINSMIILLLSQAAGVSARPKKKRDLSWLSGSWSESEQQAFDRATRDCRTVQPEDWE